MQCYLVEFFSYWYQVDPHNQAAAFFFFFFFLPPHIIIVTCRMKKRGWGFFLFPHDEHVNSAPEKNGLGFFSQIVLFVGYLEPERKSV